MKVGDTQYGGNLDLQYNKILNLRDAGTRVPNDVVWDNLEDFELIAHEQLSADSSAWLLDNIPGRYKHLLVVYTLRMSPANTEEEAFLRFNSDSGTNYDSSQFRVSDSATLAGTGNDGPGATSFPLGFVPDSSGPASAFMPITVFIPDYANTARHKSFHALFGNISAATAGNIDAGSSSGRWRSTSAITSLRLHSGSAGNVLAGSTVSLYGIRSKRFLVDPTNTLCNSLIAYWKLNETGGKRLDSWGANHLTDNSTVTYERGLRGNTAQFDNVNSEYLSGGDNADLSTGNIDFTIACWVKLYRTSGANAFVTKMDSASVLEYRFRYDTGFQFQIFDSAGTLIAGATTGTASVGSWYFVVAHHDAANDQIGVQVNNGAVTTTSTGGTGPSDTAADFGIGAEMIGGTPDSFMHGLIQNVGFWKKVLTPAERTALFNKGKGNTLINT